MLALFLGRMRHLSALQGARIIDELRSVPDWIRQTLAVRRNRPRASPRNITPSRTSSTSAGNISIRSRWRGAQAQGNQLHSRRGLSGRRDEARTDRAGGRADAVSVFLVPQGPVFDKVMSNLEEVKARKGPVIAITTDTDSEVTEHVTAKCRRSDFRAGRAGLLAADRHRDPAATAWRITSPCCAAATWTSRGISPRA